MKKVLLLLTTTISLSLTIGRGQTQLNKTDLYKMGLLGNIKSLFVITFNAEDSLGNNIKGKENSGCMLDGQPSFILPNKYVMENGFELDDIYQSTQPGYPSGKIKIIFNKQGNELEETLYSTEGIFIVGKHKYDEKNKVTESKFTFMKENGEEKFSVLYTYNYNNYGQKKSIEINDGKKKMMIGYKYDLNNRLDEKRIIGSDGSDLNYKYDNKGNLISIMSRNHKIFFSYDNENRLKKSVSHNEIIYTYGKKNDVIKIEELSSNVVIKTTKFEYKYDNVGNWIKCIVFKNEKATCIIERQIMYY